MVWIFPPTLYKNAVEKYQALGHFLNDNGLEAEIYPQGSFAFGTVVRQALRILPQAMILTLSAK